MLGFIALKVGIQIRHVPPGGSGRADDLLVVVLSGHPEWTIAEPTSDHHRSQSHASHCIRTATGEADIKSSLTESEQGIGPTHTSPDAITDGRRARVWVARALGDQGDVAAKLAAHPGVVKDTHSSARP
jgi:hypothetical protein